MGDNLNAENKIQCTRCTALSPFNSRTAGGACFARTEAAVRPDDHNILFFWKINALIKKINSEGICINSSTLKRRNPRVPVGKILKSLGYWKTLKHVTKISRKTRLTRIKCQLRYSWKINIFGSDKKLSRSYRPLSENHLKGKGVCLPPNCPFKVGQPYQQLMANCAKTNSRHCCCRILLNIAGFWNLQRGLTSPWI